jgi:glycosyltransferase involved in cell wall biosynthesis
VTGVCAVIPVYNHARTVGRVVASLLDDGLPVFLVDDGSDLACATELQALAARHACVQLLRLPENRGKGAAVMAGLKAGAAAGFTHALQIDADGQHELADVPRFMAASLANPQSLVCGQPVFDESIPRVRHVLRYLTHAMVWLNTLSFDIKDAMCGLRIYPLAATLAALPAGSMGQRMDFDIESLVRLHWHGLGMLWIPTRVSYPADGISHFRLFHDNALITWLHTRLFFGMLLRLPRILANRIRSAPQERRTLT